MFATYGGSTLDFSDNGGLDWKRAINGGSTVAQGFVTDTAGETLWCVAEAAPDRVAAFWIPIFGPDPLPSVWNGQVLPTWDSNGVYVAQADPFDPHAIYVGGEGRLGRLTLTNGEVSAELPWSVSPLAAGQPYTYIMALWTDSKEPGHIVWGGGQQGGGAAQVLESMVGGGDPHEILLQGFPQGTVRAIQQSPTPSELLAFVDSAADGSLAVYVVDR